MIDHSDMLSRSLYISLLKLHSLQRRRGCYCTSFNSTYSNILFSSAKNVVLRERYRESERAFSISLSWNYMLCRGEEDVTVHHLTQHMIDHSDRLSRSLYISLLKLHSLQRRRGCYCTSFNSTYDWPQWQALSLSLYLSLKTTFFVEEKRMLLYII